MAVKWLVSALLALAILAGGCAAGPPATPTPGQNSTPTLTPSPTASRAIPSTPDEVPRLTIEELWQKMQGNADILVVDDRQKAEYDRDHIKGAVSAPYAAIMAGQWLPPQDREAVLYCH